MERSPNVRVKICCITNEDEAWLAIRYGASALGLVSEMPSGPGIITEETITRIAGCIPPGVSSFLLTSKQDIPSILEQARRCRCNTIQLVDRLDLPQYAKLRHSLPGISLVQVIHVTGNEALNEAVTVAPHVNALLLDSGNPNLPIKTLGGTGQTHNWNISRAIRETVTVPVYLAGGLNPENISKAIQQVDPFGVDVCSGVRSNGKLDEAKLAIFMKEVYSTYAKGPFL